MKRLTLRTALVALVAAAAFVHIDHAQTPARALPPQRVVTAAPGGAAAQTASQAKIDALIASMTLDEKLSMLHGASDPAAYGQAGYLPGVPRLNIPPLRLSDGPAGIRTALPATALPAPVAMASTFSPELAQAYGRIIGRDARARHQNVVLGPMINIVRVPQGGRNFETLGEDPLLAGRLAAGEILGIQGEGLIATAKHYAFNNQENDRMTVSADVDEQTGREIELSAFEPAVRAGVGSVMCSYNKVNGTYAAENAPLLTDVLRRDWGFKGFVMSDWFATQSTVPSLKAGMEMEMPGDQYYGSLGDALKKGEIDVKLVDESVRRILTSMDAAGLLSASDRAVPDIPATEPVARDLAIAGAVLLKNQGGVLPLAKEDLQSLAAIGPTAKTLLVGGGGSANVRPMHTASPLDVLQRRAGTGARIVYAKGYDVDGEVVPSAVLTPPVTLNFVGSAALPAGSTFTWTGSIAAPKAGDYILKVQTATGGRGTVLVGPAVAAAARQGGAGRRGAGTGRGATGRGGAAPGGAAPGGAAPPAVPAGGSFPAGSDVPGDIPGFGAAALLPTADGLSNASAPIHLEAKVATPVSITVGAGRVAGAPVPVRLSWVTPDIERARIDEAVAAAKAARVAVVFAYDEGTEGRDRASLSLPGVQDALITAVAAANPRTVVVLNNGAPVLMPWADKVAAILQMWYPGQEGADATAAILLGEAAPGGRLPVTFPRRAEDAPTARPERYPGVDGKGAYSEGIFVGYRWYDQQNVEPLFPFGHGLSYTTFAYSGLQVRPAGDGYDVTFSLRNTGAREGVEVPQVYVGPPPNAPAPMAVKKLVGFERVSLAPGQSRQITVHLDARALSYWSSATHRWTVASGRRTFMVGSSSRNITLKTEVVVRPKTT